VLSIASTQYRFIMTIDTSILAKPIQLPFSKKEIKYRTLKAPMTERLSTWDEEDLSKRGRPTDELVRLYETWAKGNLGVIVTGNVMVDAGHLEAKNNAIINKTDMYLPDFARVAKAIKTNGSLAIIQLSHAGRQVSSDIQKHPVSSSDIKCEDTTMGMTFEKPTPLTKEGIKEVVDRFAYAAEVAYRAGFDGVQVHGAHGYLLSQFLANDVNQRTDEYGGPLENRSRIIFEIIAAIRQLVPDKLFSIQIKINSQDFHDGGFSAEDCQKLCQLLEAAEVDMIDLSGGTYESLAFEHKRESTKKREAFFLDFADQIRPNLHKTVLCVTGGFRSAKAMVAAITGGSCDIVGLGRPVCAEPFLVRDILEGRTDRARPLALPDQMSLQIDAAVANLHDIGQGKPITDYSKKENVDAFLESRTRSRRQQDRH
jgi:2,4-dienoyl-CoA reductase-like NADH-dependent reductase (Old Yellow Enzyme family)